MISGATRILGVIGHPVEHSSSPAMHNAALEALGLDWAYVAFHVRPGEVGRAVEGMRALQIRGLNVTVPHKSAVMDYLDEISAEARAIGAVNTIDNRRGCLKGYNTDAFGAMQSLRREAGLEVLPPRVVLLGAGGAARAVLYALLQRPEVEEVSLLNRTLERAEKLAGDLEGAQQRVRVGSLAEAGTRAREAGLLINATSAGMQPREGTSPLEGGEGLHERMVVFDLVYKPPRTRLMAQAEAAGARAFNGLGMLARQAARACEIWTGQRPPVELMLEAARKGL